MNATRLTDRPAVAAPAAARAETRPRTPPRRMAERYALPALLAAIVAFFSLLPASARTFPTSANWSVLAGNQAVVMLLAVALLLPLVAGHFDFSVGAVASASSVFAATLMSDAGLRLPWYPLAGAALGAAVGLANGLLVTRLRINSFISTLGAATLLAGLIQWRTGGQTITAGIDPRLVGFGSGTWLGVPRVVYPVAAAVLTVWYLLARTPYGRCLYAIGSNPRAARLVGIPVSRYVLLAFVAAGTLGGLAGLLQTARIGGATADSGTSLLFPALAAVFLGATAIAPGQFNVAGTVIGVLFVAVSVSGLTLAGASDWVNPVFNGAALLVAVALSSVLGRQRWSGRR
jgi:ribose/xylose/arabinose/galactoside ABC-type transport system permease subunit